MKLFNPLLRGVTSLAGDAFRLEGGNMEDSKEM